MSEPGRVEHDDHATFTAEVTQLAPAADVSPAMIDSGPETETIATGPSRTTDDQLAWSDAQEMSSHDEADSVTGREPLKWGLAALALLTALAGVGWEAGWYESHSKHERQPHPEPTAAPVPNTGPFTGVYSVELSPETELGDHKVLNPVGAHISFDIRSACSQNGCIAVADPSGGVILQNRVVFDKIGDNWVAVDTAPSSSPRISAGLKAGCQQGLSPEVWESITLTPQPDSTLSGTYEVNDPNNCNTSRTVSIRRVGDVEISKLPDPNTFPGRVSSAAEGLQGRYQINEGGSTPGTIETFCLRDGTRCTSNFAATDFSEPFVFSDGQWSLHYSGPVECSDGSEGWAERSAQLQMPANPSNPILALDGHGRQWDSAKQCNGSIDYPISFQRIGDSDGT